MINPETLPVDVEEQREWALAHKEERAFSWTDFAAASGIKSGTLSVWATGKYQGDNEKLAREMFRYRQLLSSQAQQAMLLPDDPGYFETPTSTRIRTLLQIAQAGRITIAGTGPGTGKTMTAREYAASVTNCWIVTMRPSMKTIGALMREVQIAFGTVETYGRTEWIERRLLDKLGTARKPLLIVDEANHLTLEQIEQLRSLHDVRGTGICLLGNEELVMRMEGGAGHALARLNSRIAARHYLNVPVQGDVDAFCDAWRITDAGMRKMLSGVALSPAAGGLRECAMIIETASMMAEGDGRALTLADLRDAQSTRSTRVRNAK